MKSIGQLEEMLTLELCDSLNKINPNTKLDYYNEVFGDTSVILARLFDLRLQERVSEWGAMRWIDDSLLTKVVLSDKRLSIWGIIIWGKEGTTSQWTDPFYFEASLDQASCQMPDYSLMVGDLDLTSITYEDFNNSRGVWDQDYYSNVKWNPCERNWKYKMEIKRTD